LDIEETLEKIHELGLLAVIRGPSYELTISIVEALVSGGVGGIEITYTTPNAAEVVRALNKKYGDRILLGMGSLVKPEQADEAKTAGAQFIVSPHLDEELAIAMVDSGLTFMIGAFTPSEVMRAFRLGSHVVKIFPGSQGGPNYMKALRGPFPEIPMMPTGGVNIDNLRDWFAAGAFAVGAGSNLCPTAWAKEGRFNEIRERAKQFQSAVRMARSAA
jgi:2-dehydro-3-deoxyphosphogluconate aldolase/(4S)-4-hydroxy-2-oxoglutarate aldolase